ncbi:MAG: hypothetical protein KC478_01580 [Bacteriovoracaceae bacterium]|nr:hypothetical protein [Bacteriovoracaceae bacterium]
MEEKLTFTRVPDSVYWLCTAGLQQSRASFTTIVDYLQNDPFLNLWMKKTILQGKGTTALEASLAGRGIKGLRDRVSELYLSRLESGSFSHEVELDHTLDIQDFERRFERFSTLGNFRGFLLGMYLKMKDLESETLHNQITSFMAISPEVDEILLAAQAKVPRLDWTILILSSLLKFWEKSELIDVAKHGEKAVVQKVLGLSDKDKMVFFNDVAAYAHAIDEKDFFLYQKV